MSPTKFREVLVLLLLVAIGVAGRVWQPTWSFTPTAAVTIFAGYYFAQWRLAVFVPLAILAISDGFLAAHDNLPVAIVVYTFLTLPVLLGRWLRASQQGDGSSKAYRAAQLFLCGLLPATCFYLASNFAVWLFKSDYPQTIEGLAHCYLAALPFYRSMLAGDLFYGAVAVAVTAALTIGVGRLPQREPRGEHLR